MDRCRSSCYKNNYSKLTGGKYGNTKTYIVAENWGKGFIEHSESAKFTISGFPGNVWQVPAHNKDANLWIHKVLGVVKTKAEAQAIVDAEVFKSTTGLGFIIR
jgi:hypothetical protein